MSALAPGVAAMLAGCAGPVPPPETCWPSFPYHDGWLGGDAAYSVPLSGSETLWLFGDSFVGAPGQRDRRGSHLVHNSIGLSRCGPGGDWEIEYVWGRAPDGTPEAFLERDASQGWWWLFDGFLHEDRLYLGLLEVERAAPHGPLSLPFHFTGVDLARISNPSDDVRDWRVERVSLSDDPRALPAGAMLLEGSHLYLFSFLARGDGRHPRGLARLPLSALDGTTRDVSPALEYLTREGAWARGLDADRAQVLMHDDATEMSVRFHPGLGRWLALYSYPEVDEGFPDTAPSDAVWIRTAERLEGPWSERRLVFRVPELDPATFSGHDPNTGCYAAKEHPQFSSPDRITFTYVCNLFSGRDQDPNEVLRRLLENMQLYRPIPVSVTPSFGEAQPP